MKLHPTSDDFRAACARLGFPSNGWDIIEATAEQVAAERLLKDAGKAESETYTRRGKVGQA
mgnify:CR=1 FL=1